MRKLAWLTLTALMSITSALTAGAAGQVSTGGAVRGHVTDQQGAVLPGVTITATSPSAPAPHTTVTGPDGVYRLIDLPPGDYVLTAEMESFSKAVRENVRVRAGLNLGVDFTLEVGARTETIVVRVDTPLLDVERATQAVNISGDLQRHLPLSARRDYGDFLELTPGVSGRIVNGGAGGQVYMLRGSEVGSHVIQVDGADMNSFTQGLVNDFMALSTEALEDVQIKTGAVDAASPLGVGAIVNIATPSGTNTYKGATGAVYTARRWNGNNNPSGTPSISTLFQPDAALGGPILRDRAWFFGALRYLRRENGISRTPTELANLRALSPGFEPFDNHIRARQYYLKGTVQLSPRHQAYAFYQRDRSPAETAISGYDSNFAVTVAGGHGYAGRLTSIWGSAVTTKVMAAYNDKSNNRSVSDFEGYDRSGPSRRVYDAVILSSGVLTPTGGALVTLDNLGQRDVTPTSKRTFSADLTYVRSGWLGSHEFQTGIYIQRLAQDRRTYYANNGFTTEDSFLRRSGDPSSGLVPFRRILVEVPELQTMSIRARDEAWYLQDAWKPGARLTINAGMRLDHIKGEDRLFNVVTEDAWHVGPRLGAVYVLTSDKRNVLRGSWGRRHDLADANYLGTAGTNLAGTRELYDLDLNGTFETTLSNPASSRLNSNRIIDPERSQPFIDEWIVGYQRQLPGQTSVDVSFVRRNYKDRPALVETNGIYDNGVFGYRNEALNEIYLVTSNRWNWFVYSGIEVSASHRARGVQMLASYTRGFQHVDGTWQPNDPPSFIQPETFPNDHGIGSLFGNITNSYDNFIDQRNDSWRKHIARLGATWSAPWDILLAGSYVYMTGYESGPILTRVAQADPAYGPSTLTLSNGRLVTNPLATVFRFAFPTRGEGQFRAPDLHLLNVRVGRGLQIAGNRLEIALDIFNVTNHDADQQVDFGANRLFNANFGRFFNRQYARNAQVYVRYAF